MMLFRLLALLVAVASPLTAQDKKPDSNEGLKGVTVRLLAEEAPDSIGKVYLAAGKSKSESLDLPVSQLSAPIPAPARSFALKTVNKDLPLCGVNLPEAGNAFAVVLVTAKPAGYNPIIVRTDDPAFKAGDVVFINQTGKTILGKLGGTALVLPPGQVKKERPSKPVENTYYDIAFATREEGGDKLVSSSRWPIDNTIRSYVFFLANAEGKVTFRSVDEYLQPTQSR